MIAVSGEKVEEELKVKTVWRQKAQVGGKLSVLSQVRGDELEQCQENKENGVQFNEVSKQH